MEDFNNLEAATPAPAEVDQPIIEQESEGSMLPKAEEEPPKPAGMLFGNIGYRSPEDIPKFIDTMKINDAAMVLISIASYAHKKGVFTLQESEVASKAVRVFTTPPPSMMTTPPEQKIVQPKQPEN
jgi:hypothetical protein